MLFSYTAKDETGKAVEGSIEALNQAEAIEALFRRNLTIISLKKAKFGLVKREGEPFFIFKKVGLKDLVFANRQLSMMIAAGLPLVEALEVSSGQTTNKYLKYVFLRLADDVRGGATFSSALSRYPNVFDEFFVNMVRTGELSGRLKEVLNYLADEVQKEYNLKKRLVGAMIYPIFILITVVIVITVLMVVVLPNLSAILEETTVDLPGPTKMVVGFSNFFKAYWINILIGLIILIVALFIFSKTKPGKSISHRVISKLPVFGNLFQMIHLARFTRSLSTLLVGGLPIISALETTAKVVGSDFYKKLILETARNVEGGHSIASAFLRSKGVPPALSHLMIVGERTGKLDEVLSRMADFYTDEVDRTLANIVALLEPFIIIFLGLVVGFIALSVIMPIYSLTTAF